MENDIYSSFLPISNEHIHLGPYLWGGLGIWQKELIHYALNGANMHKGIISCIKITH